LPPSKVAKRLWSLLFLVIAGFYLYGLGAVPLVGPDEPRYAEVAREMLARRDLITPTLGGLPWFEKPPLLYWLMMASYRLFGINEFAARLGPALCGLLTAILVCWVATQVARCQKICAVNEQAALEFKDETAALAQWSVLALFSSIGTIVFSRAASFDIVVTMTLTGALTFFFIWQIRIARSSARIHACGSPASVPAKTNNDWRFASALLLFGFYFFVGLSLLAKGLIGVVLPFGVIGVYFLMRLEWPDRSFSKSLLWGIPIAIATASVWYGPMIARHGGTFVDQFIVQHHFARFLTNKYHHRQPLYFYPLTLAWLVLPWTFLLAAAFVSARSWRWRGDAPVDRLRVFALAWIVVPVVFFSFSESKLAAYIVPVLPGVALLVGERIACFLNVRSEEKIIRLTGMLLLLLAGAGIWYSVRAFGADIWRAIAVALVSILVGAGTLVLPRARKTVFLLFSLATLTASAVALHSAAPGVVRRDSVRDLLTIAAAKGYGAAPIVQFHRIERTAEFYAAGRVSYRPDGEPRMLEGANEVADAAQRNGGLVLCLVPTEYEYQLLSYSRVQIEELGNNGRVSLVVVRAH